MAQTGQALAQGGGGQMAETGGSGPSTVINQYIGEKALRQIGLIAGLAAAIAAGIGLFMWAQEPAYRALYGNLNAEDASAVMEALQAQGIAYEIDRGSGTILVPADKLHNARLQLASEGLPSGSGVGFESLRKDQGFGTSQFMETARFHRALETELARTIGTLDAVRAARVHLAIPRESAFIRDNRQPSASVALNLHNGRSLSDGQVSSIVNLVAGSVTDMDPKRVSVVDQRGELLSSNDGQEGAMEGNGRQLQYKGRIEDNYARRIEALLAPIVGRDRVRAQVNADIDFGSVESTEELYDPEATAVRSEQSSSERRMEDEQVGGVPGALANQPPGAGQVQQDNQQQGQQAQQGQQGQNGGEPVTVTESATRNYEVSKTVRHVKNPMGEIQRLSVAVLLDGQQTTNDDGETVTEPLPDETIQQVRSLVAEAVGLNEERGDSINVVSTAFQPQEEVEPVETPLLEQPWVWQAGKLLLATIIGLVLILAVVRPLVYGLLGRASVRQQPQPAGGAEPEEQQQQGTPQLSGPEQLSQAAGQRQLPQSQQYEDQVTAAREVVNQEPALAANVVKNWVQQDD